MARKHANQESEFVRKIKKFFLSAFVVITFIVYFIHERNTNAAAVSPVNAATNPSAVITAASPSVAPTATAPIQATGYKNGTYTGPVCLLSLNNKGASFLPMVCP